MTKLDWGSVSKKPIETGVDHVVVYLGGNVEIWRGVTSIEEDKDGGSIDPVMYFGVITNAIDRNEHFKASVTALTKPELFKAAEGKRELAKGLFVSHQRKNKFDMSYRTLVVDVETGIKVSEKIHLVYNARVGTPSDTFETYNGTPSLVSNTYELVCVPPRYPVVSKPTAHYVIDSAETLPAIYTQLTDILYGTETTNPRFPPLTELLTIFGVEY